MYTFFQDKKVGNIAVTKAGRKAATKAVDDPIYRSIAIVLEQHRIRDGMGRTDFSARLHENDICSNATYYKLLSGNANPRLETLFKLCTHLEVSIFELLFHDNPLSQILKPSIETVRANIARIVTGWHPEITAKARIKKLSIAKSSYYTIERHEALNLRVDTMRSLTATMGITVEELLIGRKHRS